MKKLYSKAVAVALAIWLLVTFMVIYLARALRDALVPDRFRYADTNFTYYAGASTAYAKINSQNRGLRANPEARGVMDIIVDFAAIAAQRVLDGAAVLAQNDTLDVCAFPAGTLIEFVVAKLITVEGAVATIGVGDSAGATQFLTAFDANSANNTALSASTAQKFYAANDAIRLTLNSANGYTKNKVHLFVGFADLTQTRNQ